jgi:RNA polymerase-binding transcription factor DksA
LNGWTCGYVAAVDINVARKLLETRRRDLEQVIRAAEEQGATDEPQTAVSGELAGVDQHTADAATDTMEREMALSVKEGAVAHLKDIERAFQRIEDGTYGRCLVCEKEIPEGRLEAKPEAEYCIEHEPPAVPTEGAA